MAVSIGDEKHGFSGTVLQNHRMGGGFFVLLNGMGQGDYFQGMRQEVAASFSGTGVRM